MTAPALPPWTEFYSEQDLDSCIKVLQVYLNPDLKGHAKSSPKIQQLFTLGLEVFAPSHERIRELQRKQKQARKQHDRSILEGTLIRQQRPILKITAQHGGSESGMDRPPLLDSVDALESYSAQHDGARLIAAESHLPTEAADAPTLNYGRACHVCRQTFFRVHFFYDQLCPACAEFNFAKRSFSCDMTDRICLVTGARVKIGFQIALRLLRMGGTVIVTSRFPHDAALRYAKEPDFAHFASRLYIYGIDFRDIGMVHQFCRQIKLSHSKLDVLINNAAQTVRKPPAFYAHLMESEANPLPLDILEATHVLDTFRKPGTGEFLFVPAVSTHETSSVGLPASQAVTVLHSTNTSAALSQVPLMNGDQVHDEALFPPGLYDRDAQQVDLRQENSWLLQLGEISTVEMIECQVINAFAPWILCSELKPLMEKSGFSDKYIVNVSAMEGQFYRNKSVCHPHSNMAKSALNMMTRTSAAGFAKISIFMTAVDTGWITDENPVEQHANREDQPPPLDEIDAAMRVLDPVLLGMRGDKLFWGVFLKNYRPTRW
ncbi:hypothetical protein HDV03_001852 [Kappamyces sp. JEL0829]|nr:hypothetical protein HDV03_001852 [Kappamyces sp. JEL0829]